MSCFMLELSILSIISVSAINTIKIPIGTNFLPASRTEMIPKKNIFDNY